MEDLTPLHDALIGWFEAHKADLPWRRSRDPYAVWLSEIMLQQTQVTTVIPYYERFLQRFPTAGALAAAPLDEVLKLWEGLGYYSRARSLHRAAQMIMQERGGQFPASMRDLQRLPGVGRYTAGAIGSLAFGLDVPVLDGNVIRILARLFDIDADTSKPETMRMLWELAGRILPEGRAAAWNEGLMELGRRVCTPRSPKCDICPLRQSCAALQRGVQEQRPVKSPRRRTPHYDVTAAVIRREDGSILIAQRPHNGMLGGLWEFPGGKRQEGESLQACLRREIREELGIEIEVGSQIAVIRHAYTHFRITLYAFECRHTGGDPRPLAVADWVWVDPDALSAYAFPVTDQKIIAALRDGSSQLALDLR
jgi:A/G-specific adenine glycosylase